MSEHISAVAEEVETSDLGSSRRNFLGLGLAAGAAVLTFGASAGQADVLRSVKGLIYLDPLVVNFAFELEDLCKQFFQRASTSSAIDSLSPREKNAIYLIAREDQEHYDAIKKLRSRNGYKGAGGLETTNAANTLQPGFFKFPGNAFKTRDGLMSTALDIKETALFAYHGAVDLVAKDTLKSAVAIAGVEGRHLAVLRELCGIDPVPSPFEGALSPDAVGRRLKKYNFNGGGFGNRGGNR